MTVDEDRDPDLDRSPSGRFDRAFRSTVGRESTTFGFSILVTVTFGVVQTVHGSPKTWNLMLYAIGAVLSFTLLEAIGSRGFRRAMPQHPTEVVTLGTALNLFSVVAGVAAGLLTAEILGSALSWPLCPLVAGIVYLLMESLESMLAERAYEHRGDREASSVSD